MTTVHKAYSFNSQLFHKELEDKIIVNNAVHKGKLELLAKEVAEQSIHNSESMLQYLRYDESWFSSSDIEINHNDQWYILAITKFASEIPSLWTPRQSYFRILELALPILQWEPIMVTVLIRGEALSSLVRTSKNKSMIEEFKGVDQYGGWIPNGVLPSLNENLLEALRILDTTSFANIEILSTLANVNQTIRESIDQAMAMTDAAINKGGDILVLLD